MAMMSLEGIYPWMKKTLPGIDLPCLIPSREIASPSGIPGIDMMASAEATLPRQGNISQRQEGLWRRMSSGEGWLCLRR